MTDNIVLQDLKNEVVQQHIMRYVFASMFVRRKRVLDVSCGTGYGTEYLRRQGAEQVIGADISDETINFALEHYGNNIDFCVADALALPFEENSFDVVISFETIEHIENTKDFLSEIKRVLKPRGTLICSTPNKRYTWHPAFHVNEFYPKQFFKAMEGAFTLYGRYAQYISMGAGIRRIIKVRLNKTVDYVLSNIPYGEKIRKFLRSMMGKSNSDSRYTSTPRRISENDFFPKHRVTPLKHSFILSYVARILIAVCKKE